MAKAVKKKVVEVDVEKEVVEPVAPKKVPSPEFQKSTGQTPSKADSVRTSTLILFRVEGHTTWRTTIFREEKQFDAYLSHPGQKNHPKVTERRIFILDTINGTVTAK